MRLLLVTAFLISILLPSVTVTSAQTEIPKPTPKPTSDVVLKEVVKDTMQVNKGNVPTKVVDVQAKIATKEAALKQKLSKFVDKQKASKIEKVSMTLNQINANWVEQISDFLSNATKILDKLQEIVDQQAALGKDATQANAAITGTREKIASASAALATQAGMDYIVTISSEKGSKVETVLMRDKLQADWQTIRPLFGSVKQAVANAIRVAATTLGGFNKNGK